MNNDHDESTFEGEYRRVQVCNCSGWHSEAFIFVRQGQWFSKMQELVIEPNPETFRTLIMGTVKSAEGDLETAEMLEANQFRTEQNHTCSLQSHDNNTTAWIMDVGYVLHADSTKQAEFPCRGSRVPASPAAQELVPTSARGWLSA